MTTDNAEISARRATYLDPDSSTQQTLGDLGVDDSKMFGCRHLPLDSPRGGIVVCSSIQSEFIKNARREVLLGRALASRGLAAQRFHYRGTGNSFGDENQITFDSLRDDALTAASSLITDVGVDKVAFIGTRLGALVAASAATQFDAAPVALWDPVSDATSYFRELFRYLQMQRMVEDAPASDSSRDATHQLQVDGRLDVFGYAIPSKLYESLQDRRLDVELGDRARPMLLVQFGEGPALRAEHRRVVDRLQRFGFEIETLALLERQAWWFSTGWEPDDPATDELMETTCDWLDRQLVRSS